MPTYQRCEPGKARGLEHRKTHAAYGMQPVMATISAADQQYKPLSIKPATWKYNPKRTGLVKAGTVLPHRSVR